MIAKMRLGLSKFTGTKKIEITKQKNAKKRLSKKRLRFSSLKVLARCLVVVSWAAEGTRRPFPFCICDGGGFVLDF